MSVVALCGLLLMVINGVQVQAAASRPSAVGDQAPLWISVSPSYWDTRMAAALTTAMRGCAEHCSHLWVTRDGGATWRDHPLSFVAAHLAIVPHGSQRESLVTASQSGVLRSDDDGRTWHVLGPSGVPVVSPSGAIEVAVADGTDYVVDAHGRNDVLGSAHAGSDLVFATAQFGSWLAETDHGNGDDVVLRCDANLRCGGAGAPLSGDHGADVTLTVANRERDVIARTTTGLYRSTDAGRTFLAVTLPAAKESAYTTVAASDVEPADDGEVLYVALLRVLRTGADGSGSTEGGIFMTLNGGITWRTVGNGSPLDGGATAVATAPDGRLFAGYVDAQGEAGLLCYDSDNGGWKAACPPSLAPCAATCDAGSDGATPGAQGLIVDGQNVDAGPGAQSVGVGTTGPAKIGEATSAVAGGDADGGVPPISLAALGIGLAVAALALPVSTRRRRSP